MNDGWKSVLVISGAIIIADFVKGILFSPTKRGTRKVVYKKR